MTRLTTSLAMEPVRPEDIPERADQRTSRYAEVIEEFTTAGGQAVKMRLSEGANANNVATALRAAAKKIGEDRVSVLVRRGEVYLVMSR